MKVISFILISVLTTISLYAQSKDYLGTWEGKLAVGTMNLRLVFHIQEKDSALSASFDSPDQGARAIQFTRAAVNGNKVTLIFAPNNSQFEGSLNDQKTIIVGTWTQGGQSIPLSVTKTDQVQGISRPQTPQPPFTYESVEVSFPGGDKDIELSGTLTLPKGKGPFPALLLLTGSGPQNRNEEILEHVPFAVIADYFTKKGWAVLRYDDRGVGKSKGNFSMATTKDFTKDAIQALEFLRKDSRINTKKIGLCGHSEGGIIAQQIAADGKSNPNFIIMLAGPAISGADILALQNQALLQASGTDTALASWYARYLRTEVYPTVMNNLPKEQVQNRLAEALDRMFTTFSEEELKNLGINPTVVKAMMSQMTMPWLREFLQYDPQKTLQKIQCPVLALFGEKDLQVLPEINKKMLQKHCPKAQTEIVPKLNHLFQTADTGMPIEYGSIEETIAPAALNSIEKWLNSLPN